MFSDARSLSKQAFRSVPATPAKGFAAQAQHDGLHGWKASIFYPFYEPVSHLSTKRNHHVPFALLRLLHAECHDIYKIH